MAGDPASPSPPHEAYTSARPFLVQPRHLTGQCTRPPREQSTACDASAAAAAAAFPPPIAHPPHIVRRRSSMLSDLSSIRSSTSNIINPGSRNADWPGDDGHGRASHWNSLPLVFAIVPAVSGIFFNNGSAVATDIMLLALASLLLNWCIRMPWDWYHSAQMPALYAQEAGITTPPSNTLREQAIASDDAITEDSPAADAKATPEQSHAPADVSAPGRPPVVVAAVRELQSNQLCALVACFLGPVLGTLLLHAIRASLSRPSEGLVSSFNLTIFALAAEVRPASHLLYMFRARTLYLQRVVREHGERNSKPRHSALSDLNRRLGELESHLADMASANAAKKEKERPTSTPPAEVVNVVRQGVQPQLDALNRAVRRYEKRATTQTMSTEARLQDLESRLKDALVLAAAAARGGQQKAPDLLSILFDWPSTLLMIPVQVVRAIVAYPVRVLSSTTTSIRRFLFGYTRKKVDRTGIAAIKGPQVSDRDHVSLNGYRAQAARR